MLLLEPAVGVERKVVEWVHLNLAVSYRVVRGVKQRGLRAADFNGPAAVMALELRRF